MGKCEHKKIRATVIYKDDTKEEADVSIFCDDCGAYLGGDEIIIDPDS